MQNKIGVTMDIYMMENTHFSLDFKMDIFTQHW